jgi:hypothetical protein
VPSQQPLLSAAAGPNSRGRSGRCTRSDSARGSPGAPAPPPRTGLPASPRSQPSPATGRNCRRRRLILVEVEDRRAIARPESLACRFSVVGSWIWKKNSSRSRYDVPLPPHSPRPHSTVRLGQPTSGPSARSTSHGPPRWFSTASGGSLAPEPFAPPGVQVRRGQWQVDIGRGVANARRTARAPTASERKSHVPERSRFDRPWRGPHR